MCKLFIAVISIGLWFLSSVQPSVGEGAVALGRGANGAYWWGGVANRPTLQAARADAMQSCLGRGPNCSVVTTFRNGCFAIASPISGPGFTWATRRTEEEAKQFVLSECRSHGRPCVVKRSFCDSVDEAAIAAQRRFAEQQAAEEARRRRLAEQQEELAARQRREAEQQAEEGARRRRIEAETAARRAAEENAKRTGPIAALVSGAGEPSYPILIGGGVVAILLFVVIKQSKLGLSPRAKIATSVIGYVTLGLVLYFLGFKNEITLLSLPLIAGLSVALVYEIVHA